MNRRKFVGTTAAATAALLGPRLGWAADSRRIEKVGVQLYTVRDLMKQDFEGTIAKVAEIGYREVEFAGYFDRKPQQVRAVLERNHLQSPSTHVDYPSLGANWPKVVEASATIGHQYIVCPWIDDEVRKQPGGWQRAAEVFNKAGEVSKKSGIQFAYHNHHFEFVKVDGKFAYDLLLEQTDVNLVKMEMDLCWMTVAGQDPLKYFARYPGRFPMVHVKDVKSVPAPEKDGTPPAFERVFPVMTEVGSGVIDWKKIFADSSEAGIQHYFVEHDYPKDALASITESYKYLEALRF